MCPLHFWTCLVWILDQFCYLAHSHMPVSMLVFLLIKAFGDIIALRVAWRTAPSPCAARTAPARCVSISFPHTFKRHPARLLPLRAINIFLRALHTYARTVSMLNVCERRFFSHRARLCAFVFRSYNHHPFLTHTHAFALTSFTHTFHYSPHAHDVLMVGRVGGDGRRWLVVVRSDVDIGMVVVDIDISTSSFSRAAHLFAAR